METNNNPNWLITKDIAKKLKEIGYKEQCLCDVEDGYSFIDNFLKLSNRNPNVLFVITSYSYISDRTFVLNGRFYTTRAKIVFNEFDIGKLN